MSKDVFSSVVLEEDFIAIRRYNYSLKNLLEKYPDGAPNKVIAQALAINEEDVENLYNLTVAKLRRLMGVETGQENPARSEG